MALEFSIKPERLKLAKRIVAEKMRELSQDQIYDMFDEVRWSDSITLTPNGGKIKFVVTDLQIVMLAAAMAAVVEGAGEMREGVVVVEEDDIPF